MLFSDIRTFTFAAAALLGASWTTPALAQVPANPSNYAASAPAPPVDDRPIVRLSVRALGEQWADTSIAAVYRSGSFMPGIGLNVPIWGPLSAEIEAGYMQARPRESVSTGSTDDSGAILVDDPRRFHLAPLTLMAFYTFSQDLFPVDVYVGGGPSFTVFSEQFPIGTVQFESDTTPSNRGAINGAKVGFEARVGIRIDLGLVDEPRTWPPEKGRLRAIELEIFGSKRFNLPPRDGMGFNLNAWRGGVGLVMGF